MRWCLIQYHSLIECHLLSMNQLHFQYHLPANGIGSEADSLTANGIRSANGIESDTIASVHMAIDQVAVSLKTDASAGVGSTRDISEPTDATTTMAALPQALRVTHFWPQQFWVNFPRQARTLQRTSGKPRQMRWHYASGTAPSPPSASRLLF